MRQVFRSGPARLATIGFAMRRFVLAASAASSCVLSLLLALAESPPASQIHPSTTAEARARATLLHEMAHGALQVMHRDFFDDEDAHSIPSASLEDVFHQMSDSHEVDLRWLVVNTDVVNVDHRARTDFERSAVKDLAAGEPFVERVTDRRYEFAAPIRLPSQCLKCHVKDRNDNADRLAGLVISMPLQESAK